MTMRRHSATAERDLSTDPMADDAPLHDDEGSNPQSATATPPNAAARFYRPTQTRRKGSAASSRRNSMSSVHSVHSALSSHGVGVGVGVGGALDGPQSKYVAQHLRRASILEDRKARLADRAAHAEKVRLRAAVAKAARPGATASEERALAAQQARERNLASIAASCAEEVKRAKAVAEHMKEKREQELKKMRLQMEERLADAERRREELQKRTAIKASRARGQSMRGRSDKSLEVLAEVVESDIKEDQVEDQVEAEVEGRMARTQQRHDSLTPGAAANRITSWWRSTLRGRAVAQFTQLGLTIDGVQDVAFQKVTELLGEERVLVATSRVLRLCGLQEGDAGTVEEMAAVRTFLSAYLILGHPSQVLSNKDDGGGGGEQEQVGAVLPPSNLAAAQPIPRDDLANPQLQDLVAKARDLLITFETVLSRLTTSNNFTPPPALKDALPETYATFYNAFIAWKARDSSALIELMLMQFVELDAIWQTVKDSTDGSVDEVYRNSIKDNQLMLIVRIKKLAGPDKGKRMIFEAVRKARLARAKAAPTGDTKPRIVEQDLSGDSMGQEMSTQLDGSSMGQDVSGHLAGQALPSDSSIGDSRTGQTLLTPPPTPSSRHSKTRHTSQPSAGPLVSSLLPDNRIVVHELALNRDYRMDARTRRPGTMSKQEAMQALFKGIRYMIEIGDTESHARLLVRIAETIRENLQRLLKAGSPMHTFVGELLDAEIIQRELVTGNFSYDRFFASMGSLLPKLCAPIRDEEVIDLVENQFHAGSYVDRLEALIAFIDVMLTDYGNHLLSVAAPSLIASAPSYEAKVFGEGLAAGTWGLDSAVTAWHVAREKVLAEAARRDPEGINHAAFRPTPDAFYSQMLVDLFTRVGRVDADWIPAMLQLDLSRAVKSGRLTRHIVTAGAILLQCKNILKRDVRAPWKLEAGRIMTVLDTSDSIGDDRSSANDAIKEGGLGEARFDKQGAVDGIMAALESGRSMPAATKAHLRSFVTRIIAASVDAASSADDAVAEPVLRLLTTRLRGYILSRLSAASASEKVRATSTAGEKLAGLGLAEFVDRVRDLVDELGRIGAVDREAHGVWWEQVARKVEGEGA
jgi:hypothetical protein